MRHLLAILFLCASAFGQGLTLVDFVFIAGTNTVSGGGGGGTAPGPTEYWDFQEASGNRVGEVLGTILPPTGSGTAISSTAGLYGDAALFPNTFASGHRHLDGSSSLPSYETDSDFSINYWMKWVDTNAAGYVTALNVYANAFDDSVGILYNPFAGSGLFPTNTFSAYIDHGSGTDSDVVSSGIVNPTTTWQMLTIVYSGTTHLLSFYINGSLIGTTSTPVVYTHTGPLDEIDIDGETGANSSAFDEMAMFLTHALTQDEIDWLYNAGAGRQYSDFP